MFIFLPPCLFSFLYADAFITPLLHAFVTRYWCLLLISLLIIFADFHFWLLSLLPFIFAADDFSAISRWLLITLAAFSDIWYIILMPLADFRCHYFFLRLCWLFSPFSFHFRVSLLSPARLPLSDYWCRHIMLMIRHDFSPDISIACWFRFHFLHWCHFADYDAFLFRFFSPAMFSFLWLCCHTTHHHDHDAAIISIDADYYYLFWCLRIIIRAHRFFHIFLDAMLYAARCLDADAIGAFDNE